MKTFAVILAAAGKSTRFKDKHYRKPFAKLGERAVWLHSAEKFLNREDVKQLIIAVDPAEKQNFLDSFGPNVAIMGIDVVEGGDERADTVQNALAKVAADVDFVVVHDAARPCLTDEWIESVFVAGVESGAAILAAPVTSTVKRTEGAQSLTVKETIDRKDLWLAQTPQVFSKELLERAYAERGNKQPTDEAEMVEAVGHEVTVVECSPMNIKITTREDLRYANAILKALPKPKLDAPVHPFADDHLWR